jgi:hypothetical protein
VPRKDILDDPKTRGLFEGVSTGFTTFYKAEIGRPGNLLQTYPYRGEEVMYCGLLHLTKPNERNIEGWDHPASLEDCLNSAEGFDPALVALLGKGTGIKVHNQMFTPLIASFVKGRADWQLSIFHAVRPRTGCFGLHRRCCGTRSCIAQMHLPRAEV